MSEPSFASFYEKVHGYPPFPWQQRLAERVVGGSWPALLDLPTGSGKTSAIDIALYALAMKPNAAYRRIFMVVDRRIIVHQASQHARTILAKIAAPDAPIELRRIAEKLRSLFIDPSERVAANGRDTAPAAPPPFTVAELRGGMPRETEWARRPDQPVVGVSTVDQVGSRLLFRGYGVSPGMAPIHAGLLGNDVLYLLDEVHLARPFADTLRVIKTRWQHKGARFAVVRMSATPCEDRHDDRNTSSTTVVPFGLNSLDRENEVLARRLGATKTARCKEVKVVGDEQKRRAKLAKACVEQVELMLSRGARVIGVVV
ncbi:MAG TPA: CRISPR-associated endonuclease Cas3'', partial [Sorangium sp.]|nr:CRISPR-associated endonuclease Cas3'' [Sorangium sp.]